MLFRRALVLLPFLLLAGCQNAPPTAAPVVSPVVSSFASPKDDLGREIPLKAPAKRVIAIGPGAIETIFALGAGKSLVGRDDYADFPIQAKKVAIAGDYKGPNVEKSIALRPDLVIVQGETWDKARVEQWQTQIGAPVAALVATNLLEVAADIEKIGQWTGHDAKSSRIAASLRPKIGADFAPGPSAFIEISRSPLSTAGQKTLVDSVLSQARCNNIARVSGYQPYGLESLLANPPDVYIVPSKAKRDTVIQQLRADAALSKLKCVREGQVVVVDPDLILRPGPRLQQGIAQLRKAIGK